MWFQCWTLGVGWPLDVGGWPLFSVPAYVPVTFEAMILPSALSLFFAFLLVCRLFSGKRQMPRLAGVSDDRFALLLEATESTQRADPAVWGTALCRNLHLRTL